MLVFASLYFKFRALNSRQQYQIGIVTTSILLSLSFNDTFLKLLICESGGEMKGISGKNVVVTAGGSGIGLAIAHTFSSLGANVTICDVSEASLQSLSISHPEITAVKADVADETQISYLFDEAVKAMGGVDILVNNAGISGPTAAIEDIALQDWQACMRVNIDGCFLCCRHVVPLLKEQGSGSIINIASTAGTLAYPMRAPYAASKWAMVGLTKTLAMELGPYNIRTNSIAPGSINNPRMDGVITREAASKGVQEQEIRDTYAKQSAMRTFIDPEEIADMAVFLSSDLGRNINGQIIAVDGFAETITT